MKNFNKIIDLIIKELFNTNDVDSSKKRVLTQLLESGVTLEEVDQAFTFIVKKIKEEHTHTKKDVKKIRILSKQERSHLSRDAQMQLYDYYYNNAITWQEMEEVIKDAEKTNRVLDSRDLRRIIEKNIFAKKNKNIMVERIDIN